MRAPTLTEVHELALIEAVIDAVRARVGDRKVRVVRVRAGALTAVVPAAMTFAFEASIEATSLEGARLEVVLVPARISCRSCGVESESDRPLPLCACGSADVSVHGGDELVIEHVEVAKDVRNMRL